MYSAPSRPYTAFGERNSAGVLHLDCFIPESTAPVVSYYSAPEGWLERAAFALVVYMVGTL